MLVGGLTGCVRATTCVYGIMPASGLIVDRHPDSEPVVVASPCSGHGFKAFGGDRRKSLAELVTAGATTLDDAPFSLARRQATANV